MCVAPLSWLDTGGLPDVQHHNLIVQEQRTQRQPILSPKGNLVEIGFDTAYVHQERFDMYRRRSTRYATALVCGSVRSNTRPAECIDSTPFLKTLMPQAEIIKMKQSTLCDD